MKKFLSIILSLCLIASLFVMPVSAASMFDSYLDLDASNIIYHDVAATATAVGEYSEMAEYPISNLFDGDPTTTAAISFYGQSYKQGGATKTELKDIFLTSDLVIDLGAQYEVTALQFTAPTADQATAINAAYPSAVALNANESWWVGSVQFFTENPVTNPSATAANGTMTTSKVNNGVKVPAGTYRYIKFNGRYYNQGPGFMNEMKVKVAAKDDGSMKYADFYQVPTNVADPTYPLSNLFDGDKTTPALLSLRASLKGSCDYGMRVVDLGEAKTIEKLRLTAPSNYGALLDAIGVSNHTANYCDIIGYENEPTFTLGLAPSSNGPLAQDPSGIKLCGGSLSTKDVDVTTITSTPIRYLVFHTTMSGYPGMLNELEIVEDDRAGSATFDVTAAAGQVDSTTIDIVNGTGSWTVVGEHPTYPISNLFDGDPSTVGWVINRDTNGTHRGITITIDLGKDTELSKVTWNFPSNGGDLMDAIGYQVVGGSANNFKDAVNSWDGTGCGVTLKSADGTVTTKTTYGVIGTDDWRKAIPNLGEGFAYRYITITAGMNYTMLLNDFIVEDIEGNNVFEAKKDVIRFFVAPTLTSKFFDTEEFGMYIVPFAIFDEEGDAETSGVKMSMPGKIVTGQNYAADLSGIPAEAADEPIIVVPFVKLGGDYFFGDASEQYTLNGLK